MRDARAEKILRDTRAARIDEQHASFLDDELRERVITFMREASFFIVFLAANTTRARLGCKKGLARMGHQGLKRL